MPRASHVLDALPPLGHMGDVIAGPPLGLRFDRPGKGDLFGSQFLDHQSPKVGGRTFRRGAP
jgi:hypothetical protein